MGLIVTAVAAKNTWRALPKPATTASCWRVLRLRALSGNKSQASRGGKDYWLVKINSNGTQLWDKSFGGSQDDELYSVGITAGGDYFVAGHSSSGQSGDKSQPSRGSSDYWMLKVSKTGQKLWDKTFWRQRPGNLTLHHRSYRRRILVSRHF